MKKISIIAAAAVLFFSSCSKTPVNNKTVKEAMKGLEQCLLGKNIETSNLFFPGSIYFNGKANSGEKIVSALKDDFHGITRLTLKSEYPGPPINQTVTVHQAKMKDGSKKFITAGWHKIRGKWVVLFMCKADSEALHDMTENMKEYQSAFNNHNLSELMKRFYSDDVIRVITSNTVRGIDTVRRGYAVIENDPAYVNSWSIHEQLSLGNDYSITIGEIIEHKSTIGLKYIYVWKMADGNQKMVVNFDYK